MSNVVDVVGVIGKPGSEVSATFSPLDRGDKVDVGKIVAEQLEELDPVQTGYNEDEIKYNKQIQKD